MRQKPNFQPKVPPGWERRILKRSMTIVIIPIVRLLFSKIQPRSCGSVLYLRVPSPIPSCLNSGLYGKLGCPDPLPTTTTSLQIVFYIKSRTRFVLTFLSNPCPTPLGRESLSRYHNVKCLGGPHRFLDVKTPLTQLRPESRSLGYSLLEMNT